VPPAKTKPVKAPLMFERYSKTMIRILKALDEPVPATMTLASACDYARRYGDAIAKRENVQHLSTGHSVRKYYVVNGNLLGGFMRTHWRPSPHRRIWVAFRIDDTCPPTNCVKGRVESLADGTMFIRTLMPLKFFAHLHLSNTLEMGYSATDRAKQTISEFQQRVRGVAKSAATK
jgi:hypothetical protein